jgi:hypothetical protein
MKKLHIASIAVFLLILVLPIALLDTNPEAVSLTENRKLTSFPTLKQSDNASNQDFQQQLQSYLNDRIGFRGKLAQVHARVKLYALQMSPSDKIHVGTKGWYYIEYDNSLGIAKGTYSLTHDDLERITQNQQAISTYYKNRGIDYFLMLTPAKPSIYPEYIGWGDYSIQKTPVDIVAEHLKSSMGLEVISPKNTLVDHKSTGQLFRKQDSHWTTLGAYYAYTDIISQMNQKHIIKNGPIEVTVGETNYNWGDANQAYGDINMLTESVPDITWNTNVYEITSGEFYDNVRAVIGTNPGLSDLTILENPSAEGGTLLLYGDSQIQPIRKIPWLMAEHFKRVVYVGIDPEINTDLDTLVQPNCVLFSYSERYTNSRMTRALEIPA